MKKKIFTKHNFKWMFAFLFAFMFTYAICQCMEVKADSSTTISFGQEYSGITVEGQINKYYFTCPSAGRVTINLNVLNGRVNWSLLDSDYNLLDSSKYHSTSESASGSNRYVIDLAAGTYEFDTSVSWTAGADYTLSFAFASANETYTYSNDLYIDVASQQAIPFFEKITGQFAVNDNIDYYKLVMPTKGTVNFSFVNDTGRIKFSIRNLQDIAIVEKIYEKGTLNYSYTLDKGTYYLCFNQLSVAGIGAKTGNYYFTASFEVAPPKNVTVKSLSATSLKVTAEKNGEISGYDIRYKRGSGSWKTVAVKGNKNLSRSLTEIAPGSYSVQVRTYCTVSGKNYYSVWSETKSVSCQMKKPTNVKVKNSVSKGMKITAKKSENITGYMIRYKKNSGSWKNVKVKGNKNLSKTIKNLKKGSTYNVQIRTYCVISGKTYYSQWSQTKSVNIKK